LLRVAVTGLDAGVDVQRKIYRSTCMRLEGGRRGVMCEIGERVWDVVVLELVPAR
jgi:hypothetical protein